MVIYEPKSGITAGRRNFKKVKECLEQNPNFTGVEISKAVGLSAITVYSHLKKLQVKD